MRINAYLLAADPAWLIESVSSYYSLAARIVVSYDADNTSWTGTPLDVDACLDAVRRIDIDGKITLAPGHFARPGHSPLDNETHQRREALDVASSDADWVLQLDTDEVLASPATFADCLAEAEARGFDALDYPARNLYRQLGRGRFLEHCGRFWTVAAGFPGPVAIRAGSTLRLCRQADVNRFRVDFRATSTDPFQSRRSPVHRVVPTDRGIYHYSWVRSDEVMRRKSRWSGHANDYDWTARIERWRWSGRHPWRAIARTPLERAESYERLRIASVPLPAHALAAERQPC